MSQPISSPVAETTEAAESIMNKKYKTFLEV
jgi:hypothetical protein